MSETHRINSQLKRAYQGEAWHGPSLRELLDGVAAAQAAARPVANAHSIWELVNHIIAWEQIVRRRLEGEALTEIPDEMNFPPVSDTSEDAWQATLRALEASNQALRNSIKQMGQMGQMGQTGQVGQAGDAKLDEIVPGMVYTNYFMLHGAIQHDLYHAGQIALLKKMVT